MESVQFREAFIPKLLESKLIFGSATSVKAIEDGTERVYEFSTPTIFGVHLWFAKGFKATSWNLYVLETLPPGIEGQLVDQVSSEVDVLLEAHGQKSVRKARGLLRELNQRKPLTDYTRDDFLIAAMRLRRKRRCSV